MQPACFPALYSLWIECHRMCAFYVTAHFTALRTRVTLASPISNVACHHCGKPSAWPDIPGKECSRPAQARTLYEILKKDRGPCHLSSGPLTCRVLLLGRLHLCTISRGWWPQHPAQPLQQRTRLSTSFSSQACSPLLASLSSLCLDIFPMDGATVMQSSILGLRCVHPRRCGLRCLV